MYDHSGYIVAIQQLADRDPKTFGDRFMLWESLRHPNIARLHFVAPNELTLYQEYYPNHDLREASFWCSPSETFKR